MKDRDDSDDEYRRKMIQALKSPSVVHFFELLCRCDNAHEMATEAGLESDADIAEAKMIWFATLLASEEYGPVLAKAMDDGILPGPRWRAASAMLILAASILKRDLPGREFGLLMRMVAVSPSIMGHSAKDSAALAEYREQAAVLGGPIDQLLDLADSLTLDDFDRLSDLVEGKGKPREASDARDARVPMKEVIDAIWAAYCGRRPAGRA